MLGFLFLMIFGVVLVSLNVGAVAFNSTENVSINTPFRVINSIEQNPNNGLIYISGDGGSSSNRFLGIYNFSSNSTINITPKINWWASKSIDTLKFVPPNIIMMGGVNSPINFGMYNESSNSSIDLTTYLPSNSMYSIEYNSKNGLVYIGGADQSSLMFYSFNISNNATVSLNSKISETLWEINSMVYDNNTELLFIAGHNGTNAKIWSYNFTSNTTIDLSPQFPFSNKENSGDPIDMSINPNGMLYIGIISYSVSQNAELWSYNTSSNQTINLTAKLFTTNTNAFAQWNTMDYDKDRNRIYFGYGYYDILTNNSFNLSKTYSNSFIKDSSSGSRIRFNSFNHLVFSSDLNRGSLSVYPTNTPPSPYNVSISDLPLATTAKGHCKYNDSDNDVAGGNQTYWYINKTLLNSNNNSFILGAENVTTNANITFSCRYNDTFIWSNWINSSTATVGDAIPPVITNQSINGNSFTTNDKINLTAVSTDNSGIAPTMKVEINFTNYTMALIDASINLYSANPSLGVGSFNVTNFYSTDGSNNIARDLSNFTFTVTNPPSSGGGSGGGGGGGGSIAPTAPPVIILGNLTLVLSPPIIDTNFIYTPFKTKTQRFSIDLIPNKALDRCISNVFECTISNNIITVALNYSNDSVFIGKVSDKITLIDKAGLAKTISSDVRFINLAYAFPFHPDVISTKYLLWRLQNGSSGRIEGIRAWFVIIVGITFIALIYLIINYT